MLRSALDFETGVRIALYLTLPDMYRVKNPKRSLSLSQKTMQEKQDQNYQLKNQHHLNLRMKVCFDIKYIMLYMLYN